ncbi:glucodextranase DOMON-like domain-containing protein [Thermosphaera aggregans]|uniref:Pullulanase alpha-amylase n=1 Tax=Thermosphaera aggregans (strain DSM 11486 / M11TL) TaxID=633148 RepID=D5U365_THEAM|nr:glucodextranase DOMON-like domain-containing protein [Thermosphaera aggregans]ADG91565.1 pullulanase; alpha-amylase [Thermosphaera aggregans DSM 11486]
MHRGLFSILLLVMLLFSLALIPPRTESAQEKIYLALVWHYHQPWYYSVDESYFTLPWVRMHSVGNYYKMAYILSKYPDVRATFTFSGSLLEMLVDYVEDGKMDVRQIISWKIVNGTVNKTEVFSMLRTPGGFFDINWNRIVNVIPRFSELRSLAQSAFSSCTATAISEQELIDCVVNQFTGGNLTGQNVVDLAVLFNLFWIDPSVAEEQYPDIYQLMNRAYQYSSPGFTVSDLQRILEVHEDIMSRITQIYRNLSSTGQVELIPVPYSHPLAPIIVDFGWSEDIEVHVNVSIELFKRHFNYTPVGVWPAEQAVNSYVVEAFRKAGITWTITDESILAKTGVSTSDINNLGVPWYIDFPSGRIYVFFRHTELSNLLSFQYSNWNHVDAVNDFVNRVLSFRSQAAGPRLVVVALDGENPWENYERFGDLFLNTLYQKITELQSQGVLETITPREFIERFPATARELPLRNYQYLDLAGKDISNIPAVGYGDDYGSLPRKTVQARLPEGSWSGGEVTIWIGDRQENVAWMWLAKARSDILGALGLQSFKQLYEQRPDIARYLLKAEASDWWWWYGGDGGGSPETFDPIFKAYLKAAYELAGLTAPDYLSVKAYPDGRPIGSLNTNIPSPVDAQVTIDGVFESLWWNSVSRGAGLNITVGSTYVRNAFILFDPGRLYIGFNVSATGIDLSKLAVAIYFTSSNTSLSPLSPGYNIYPRHTPVDLGIYLVREVLIYPANSTVKVNVAGGSGSWISVGDGVGAAHSQGGLTGFEAAVPWNLLGIPRGEYTYLAAAVYYDNALVEWSPRLGLVHQLQVPVEAVTGNIVFEMDDPIGDDDGAGGYTYPTNPVFAPGVFDLVKFQVVDAGDKVVFTITFRNLGGNPWGGPNGWSMQQVHIYVHTTMSGGKTDTFGLNVKIAEEHAWHMALIVAPGWGTDPVPIGEKTGIYYYDKESPTAQEGDFKAYADTGNNRIIVEVPKSMLYDTGNIDKWIYVVAVTSHDGYSPTRIRAFQVGGGEWVVGVPSDYAVAVLNGVLPYVLDLLAETKEDQYSMLKSYSIEAKALATLRGVGAYVPPTETTTTPTTTTETTTPTTTPTVTTPTNTTPSPTTIPEATIPETTTPAQSFDYTLIIIVVVVLIAVGVVAFLYMKRRP